MPNYPWKNRCVTCSITFIIKHFVQWVQSQFLFSPGLTVYRVVIGNTKESFTKQSNTKFSGKEVKYQRTSLLALLDVLINTKVTVVMPVLLFVLSLPEELLYYHFCQLFCVKQPECTLNGNALREDSYDRILWSTIEYLMSHGYSHTSNILQFGFWQCAESSFTIVTTIRHYIVMIARFTIYVIFRLMKWKGTSNKHFSLSSLFSTGWFQEQIRAWFQTWTKINTGALWQIDIYIRQVPSSDIVQQFNKQINTSVFGCQTVSLLSQTIDLLCNHMRLYWELYQWDITIISTAFKNMVNIIYQ